MATARIGFQSVIANTKWEVQPPVGEEWCLTSAAAWGDGTTCGMSRLVNATAETDCGFLWTRNGIGDGDLEQQCLRDAKVFVNNTHVWFMVENQAETAKYLYYSALELDITVRGDVSRLSANTSWIVQPAVGEEWLVTTVQTTGDGTNPGYMVIYDGANSSSRMLDPTLTRPAGEGDAYIQCYRDGKLIIDNSIYMYLRNEDEYDRGLGYSGMLLP